MLKFILDRLKEKSTIVSIVTIGAGLIGVQLAPDQVEAIAIAVAAITAVVAVFTPSK